MEDDIDDLLNEVENKFCATDRQKSAKKDGPVSDSRKTSNATTSSSSVSNASADYRRTPSTKSESNKKKCGDAADLNAMIDDIFEDSAPLSTGPTQPSGNSIVKSSTARSSSLSSSSSTRTSKCFPVYIGGSKCPKGLSTAVHKRSCDMLRCTDCDFHVEMFDDVSWHPKTDYLFLRNNIPDYDKVKVNLVTRKGFRAYACQCMWKSIDELVDLQEFSNLKWVCGKH